MNTLMVVIRTTDADGVEHGIALAVPDYALTNPEAWTYICFSAMQQFVTHCRDEGIVLRIGGPVTFEIVEQ